MTLSRKALCVVYGLIGLVALFGTWSNNLSYLGTGFADANLRFWVDTMANPASRSITIDIFFLSLAALLWLVLEARRLEIRGAWLYILVAIFVAVSFAFPMFMIHRERALARRDPASPAGRLSIGDMAGLSAIALGCVGYLALTVT
jgi:hypothetical protein